MHMPWSRLSWSRLPWRRFKVTVQYVTVSEVGYREVGYHREWSRLPWSRVLLFSSLQLCAATVHMMNLLQLCVYTHNEFFTVICTYDESPTYIHTRTCTSAVTQTLLVSVDLKPLVRGDGFLFKSDKRHRDFFSTVKSRRPESCKKLFYIYKKALARGLEVNLNAKCFILVPCTLTHFYFVCSMQIAFFIIYTHT